MRKANGKWRMCVDYGALNTRTSRDQYPLPWIQSILSTLGGSTVFSKIDLVSGFHQIRITDEDTAKTTFNTQFEALECTVILNLTLRHKTDFTDRAAASAASAAFACRFRSFRRFYVSF